MKYFVCALLIIFSIWVNGYCQESGDSYDNSDTAYQTPDTSLDNSAAPDTGKTYYSKYDAGDFRSTHWGMTKEEVRQAETATPDYTRQGAPDQAGYGGLYYTGQYGGYQADIEYTFANDSLVSAEYVFDAPDDEDYMNQFDNIKMDVDADYWPADYDDIDVASQSYKDDPSSWENDISNGDEEREADWYTSRSTITLDMWGDAGTIVMELIYKPGD